MKNILHMIRVVPEAVKPFFEKDFQEALDLILKNNPGLEFHKMDTISLFVLEYTVKNPLKYVTISSFDSNYNPTINEFVKDIKKGFMDEHVFIPRFSSANELKMKYSLKELDNRQNF